RRVLEAAVAAGLAPTVVTFDPHPRIAFGYEVELLTALRRRLELIGEAGIEETLVVEVDLDLGRLEPEVCAERVLRPDGREGPDAGLADGEPAPLPGATRARVRDLRGRRRRPPSGNLDRHEPALRRRGASRRGAPAQLRGRPLRPEARAPALAPPARRAVVRE